jgi:hypothetical protein
MQELATPITISSSYQISQFEIQGVAVVPFTQATIMVFCYDASGNIVSTKNITMTGSDYSSWGANDAYLTSYVAMHLND